MAHHIIIIPGDGVRPDATVPPWVANRCDRALELRRAEPVLCLSAGTTHKPPPLDDAGFPVPEAAATARYLLARGLDPGAILMETASLDTIGNAFFARALHTDPREWRRLLLICSAFHMQRVEAIFRWVFGIQPDRGYELEFETVPDVGIEPENLAFRQAREAASLERVRELSAQYRTLAQMHEFVFHQHNAYSAAGLLQPRERSAKLERVY